MAALKGAAAGHPATGVTTGGVGPSQMRGLRLTCREVVRKNAPIRRIGLTAPNSVACLIAMGMDRDTIITA